MFGKNFFSRFGSPGWDRFPVILSAGLFLGFIQPLFAQPALSLDRAQLEVKVWRLHYNSSVHPELGWQSFDECSAPPEVISADQLRSFSQSSNERKENRTQDGYLRHAFLMRRPGEEMLSKDQIQKRIDLLTGVLTEGLKIPKGEQTPSGRQLIIQKDQETVYLIDTDINVLKAQLIFDGLFPPPVISRPAPPLPSEQDVSLVINALKTKHRGTMDLENVLNRVTGRIRDNDDQYSDNRDPDRMKTRFTGDAASGNLVVTSPGENRSYSPPSTGQSSAPVDRYQSASVKVVPEKVPSRERFRRFGKMDFVPLSTALGEKGRLKVLHDRSHNLVSKRALALSAGPIIPFIHYQPDASQGDYKPQSAKIGLTLNVVPIKLSEKAWQVSIITEQVDFLRYPTVEKNYLEFSSIILSGDTLVFKKMVPEEVSDDARINADVAGAAETLILLTLKEKE